MASTQTWVYALIIYFLGLTVVVTLFGIANSFPNGEVTTAGVSGIYEAIDDTTNETNAYAQSGNIDWGETFKFVWSFFGWNLYVNDGEVLMQYLWVVRIFLVYLPLLALVVSLFYSLPFIGGH